MCLKPSVLPPFVFVAVLRCVQSMKRKGARLKVEDENESVANAVVQLLTLKKSL